MLSNIKSNQKKNEHHVDVHCQLLIRRRTLNTFKILRLLWGNPKLLCLPAVNETTVNGKKCYTIIHFFLSFSCAKWVKIYQLCPLPLNLYYRYVYSNIYLPVHPCVSEVDSSILKFRLFYIFSLSTDANRGSSPIKNRIANSVAE